MGTRFERWMRAITAVSNNTTHFTFHLSEKRIAAFLENDRKAFIHMGPVGKFRDRIAAILGFDTKAAALDAAADKFIENDVSSISYIKSLSRFQMLRESVSPGKYYYFGVCKLESSHMARFHIRRNGTFIHDVKYNQESAEESRAEKDAKEKGVIINTYHGRQQVFGRCLYSDADPEGVCAAGFLGAAAAGIVVASWD